jgi:hypothetical protein
MAGKLVAGAILIAIIVIAYLWLTQPLGGPF